MGWDGRNATNIHGAGVVLRVNIHRARRGTTGGGAVMNNAKSTPTLLHFHPYHYPFPTLTPKTP